MKIKIEPNQAAIPSISEKAFKLIEEYVKAEHRVRRGLTTHEWSLSSYKSLCEYIAELEKDY